VYVFVLCKTLRTVFFSARLRPLHFLHNEFVPGRQNERHDSRYATIAYLTKRTDYYIYAAAVAVSRIPKHRPAAIVIVPTIYRSTTGIIKKESSKRTTRTVSRYTGVPNTANPISAAIRISVTDATHARGRRRRIISLLSVGFITSLGIGARPPTTV